MNLTEEMVSEIVYFHFFVQKNGLRNIDSLNDTFQSKLNNFLYLFSIRCQLNIDIPYITTMGSSYNSNLKDMYNLSQVIYKNIMDSNDIDNAKMAIDLYQTIRSVSKLPPFYKIEEIFLEFVDDKYGVRFSVVNFKKSELVIKISNHSIESIPFEKMYAKVLSAIKRLDFIQGIKSTLNKIDYDDKTIFRATIICHPTMIITVIINQRTC